MKSRSRDGLDAKGVLEVLESNHSTVSHQQTSNISTGRETQKDNDL